MSRRLLTRLSQSMILGLMCIALLGAGNEPRFSELGHKLMCKCGCGQVLLECNHVGCQYSERMRAELMGGIDRGDNDDLILQSFVQKYGATVLSAPTTTGFNRVAWIMPYLTLVVGLLGVGILVKKWKYHIQPLATPAGTPEQVNAFREKARQETEL